MIFILIMLYFVLDWICKSIPDPIPTEEDKNSSLARAIVEEQAFYDAFK